MNKDAAQHSAPSTQHLPSWRERLLAEFIPGVARLTLVSDPDGLLLEEGVLQGIRERGFELLPFEDHLAFRYAYESRFRSHWDAGEETDLVVVLRSASNDLQSLPYDLLQAGRQLSFSLGDLFPNLSYAVVASLDLGDLDALHRAQARYKPGRLGDNDTKEFLLRHVFGVAPELVKRPSDILSVLLKRHFQGQRLPAVLDERFIKLLRGHEAFEAWPLERVVPDREAFFAFLQERWPVFLYRLMAPAVGGVRLHPEPYGLLYPGPAELPFEHDDVRVYIDNLFLEGYLQPVPCEKAATLTAPWVLVGAKLDPKEDQTRRLDGLLREAEKTVPEKGARHGDWLRFAHRWAELSALKATREKPLSGEVASRLQALRARVDAEFEGWLRDRYAGLHSQPPVPPVMVHHIPRLLARRLAEVPGSKVAFLLVDGLAFDQWVSLREVLEAQRSDLVFREGAVFAWIPTLTSVSRQAAFAGTAPLYFGGALGTTDREPKLWSKFWADQGVAGPGAGYVKGLGDGPLDEVTELLSHPQLRAWGAVIDKVDKILHGIQLGAAGMHNQVRQWASQGYLARLLDELLARGFTVFLSSDHGNLQAKGIGRPAEGVTADVRGERARIYPAPALRATWKTKYPDALEWPPIGLPDGFFPLLAPGRTAFVAEGATTVGHGGASLEEVVVPLVEIARRQE